MSGKSTAIGFGTVAVVAAAVLWTAGLVTALHPRWHHWWVALDFRKTDSPAVAWIDVEVGEDLVLAPSFVCSLIDWFLHRSLILTMP